MTVDQPGLSTPGRRLQIDSRAPLRWAIGLGLAVAAALAVTQAVRSGAEPPAIPVQLRPLWPIPRADAFLRAEGWTPRPIRQPLPFERQWSGNSLASLSACSGSGMGFCRYDYQRGHRMLAVVTTPGPKHGGLVHSWFHPN